MFTLNMKASGRYETPAELDPLTQLKNVVSGMATKLATLEKNESPCAQHVSAAVDAVNPSTSFDLGNVDSILYEEEEVSDVGFFFEAATATNW